MTSALESRDGDTGLLRRKAAQKRNLGLFAIFTAASPWQRVALWTLTAILVAAVWEFAGVVADSELILPRLSSVVVDGWAMYVTEGSIYKHLAASGFSLIVGFLLSLTAVPVGLVIGANHVLRTLAEPVVTAIYALPRIALVPLAIVWFGLGYESKVAIIFLGAFVMILITVIGGAGTVDREFHEVAMAFQIHPVRRFFTITVPGTVPFIFTGLRLGIGRALVGVVAAELFSSSAGLGYLLSLYGQTLRTGNVFVVLATLAILGVGLTFLVDIWARRFDRWRL